MRPFSLPLAIALAAAFASPAIAQEAAPYQSLASAAYANLTFGTQQLPFADVGGVTGRASNGAYGTATQIDSLSQTWYLPGSGMPGFKLQLQNARAEASGSPGETSSGSVSMDGATLSLVPPSKSATSDPVFYVTIGRNAGETLYSPGAQQPVYATTSQDQVTIGGSAFGKRTIVGRANPPANTVIFSNDGVTVTLNAISAADAPTCAGCATSIPGLETDAVRIDLHEVPLGGKLLSGTMILGRTVSN